MEVLGGHIAMTTLPNIGLTLPTRGAPGAGAWGDTEDANSALIDAHDHTSGKGVRIPTSGLNINADLSFSSLYAPTALHRITFSSVAALSSNNKSLFVSSADNELYWRSNAGANVKLTSGSSLNVAAFTGGIGGDYTAVSASVQYDDANKRYTFKQGGGTNWARLQSGPLRLVELGTSETVFVEQAAPAALAASYTVTWPLALPAAAQAITVDNTGAMSVGASFALTANNSVTVSGTGDFKHGDRIVSFPGSAFVAQSGGFTISSGDFSITTTGAASLVLALPFRVGDRIKSVTIARGGDGAVDVTNFNVQKTTAGGTGTSLGSTTITNVAAGFADTVLDVTDTTLASGETFAVFIQANAAAFVLLNIRVTYDRP